MLLATDAVVNQAANWSYMFAGQAGAPVVIRAIVNRGGEQGAQHSQALHAIFAHIPGLKVVMPATPYDAKGLLISAVYDGNPVVYIDDRWLYDQTADVPEEQYQVPIGKGAVRTHGEDITIVGISYAAAKAVEAAVTLHEKGIDAEVIDLRSIKPWDSELVISSIKRTGRLLVTDIGWRSGGIAAEIIATAAESALDAMIAPPARVTLPDVPAPTSKSLETSYYFGADEIAAAAEQLVVHGRTHLSEVAQ